MAEIDLPEGNSYRSKAKPPEPRVEMVARGRISESPIRRIRESIFETSGKQLLEFVIFDVLVPQVKDGLSSIIDRVLYGEGRGHRVGPYRKAQSYVNYSRTSTDGSVRDPKRNLDTRKRVNHDFRDIAFDDRSEAELILERLGDCIEEYDVATVGDFYAAAGITADYTDQNWGWTSLRDACVRRTRAGSSSPRAGGSVKTIKRKRSHHEKHNQCQFPERNQEGLCLPGIPSPQAGPYPALPAPKGVGPDDRHSGPSNC